MDTFGRAAWMLVLAGSACLPFVGCEKTRADRFETYHELEKTTPDRPTDQHSVQKSVERTEPGPLLTSTPNPAPAPPPAPLKTVAEAARVVAVPSKTEKPASSSPASSSPASSSLSNAVKTAAARSGDSSSGTLNPSGISRASLAAVVVPKTAAAQVLSAGRKVQLLVPERSFKSEGPEGAWRVTYNDIDLLKVLNMDPVPPNAADLMPDWLKGLEGRRIRIRGFMYPTFQAKGIRAFGLARDNQICCFGRNPKIYDLFDVLMRKGFTTNFLPNLPFDVVGVFHIRPEAEDGKLYHLYEMDDATVITK